MAEKKLSEFLPARTPLGSDLVPTLRSTEPTSTANDISTISAIGVLNTLTGIVDAKRDFGAVGDGITDDTLALQAALDAAFGPISAPHGTAGVTTNKQVYFPPGNYKITAPLQVKYMHGGRVFGAGRFVTKITQATASTKCFVTNGCGYCWFGSMYLENDGGAVLFDLSWDGSAGGAALQSVTFENMFFYRGTYGVLIAGGGFQGDTILFLNCFWYAATVAGLSMSSFNAIGIQVYGGDFQYCTVGIKTLAGAANIVSGTSFQLNQECDIRIDGSSSNVMHLSGIRTESTNFVHNYGGMNVRIDACSHISATNTLGSYYFANGGQAVISTAITTYGFLRPAGWTQLRVENSIFGPAQLVHFDAGLGLWTQPTNLANWCLELENVSYGANVEIRRQRWTTPDQGVTVQKVDYDVTSAGTFTPGDIVYTPTVLLDASDTDHLWTTFTGSAPFHSGVPVNGSAIQVWDDEVATDLAGIYETLTSESPTWRSGGSSPMALPCLQFNGTTNRLKLQPDAGGYKGLSDYISKDQFALLAAFRATAVSINNDPLIGDDGSAWGIFLINTAGSYSIEAYGLDPLRDREANVPMVLNKNYVIEATLHLGVLTTNLYDATGLLNTASVSCGHIQPLTHSVYVGAAQDFGATTPRFQGFIGEIKIFNTYNVDFTGAFRTKWVP